MSNANRGFTLMEVLVSVVILSIGIVGVLGGLTAMSKSQIRAFEVEHVQRLAIRKIDELLATEAVGTTGTTGDFTDYGEPGYEWKTDVQPSGIENLQTLTLTVTKTNDSSAPSAKIDTLYYLAPATTGAATP